MYLLQKDKNQNKQNPKQKKCALTIIHAQNTLKCFCKQIKSLSCLISYSLALCVEYLCLHTELNSILLVKLGNDLITWQMMAATKSPVATNDLRFGCRRHQAPTGHRADRAPAPVRPKKFNIGLMAPPRAGAPLLYRMKPGKNLGPSLGLADTHRWPSRVPSQLSRRRQTGRQVRCNAHTQIMDE
jgi:hypothetical protein